MQMNATMKDMPVVTVEQIVRFREKAISVEHHLDSLVRRSADVLEGFDDGLDAFGNDGAMPTRIEKLRQILNEIEASK
jgi:hypothetical protein